MPLFNPTLNASVGDLNQISFSAANNQAVAANVTRLLFSTTRVRAAQIFLSVFVDATVDLYEAFDMLLIQKDGTWEMSQNSVGDISGFTFTVTNAGQIQYTNLNYAGFVSATVKFRAITTRV